MSFGGGVGQEDEAKFHRDMLILRTIHGELVKLSQVNEKLAFAEESVDRLRIAVQQQQELNRSEPPVETQLTVSDEQLESAKEELALLRETNNRSSKEIEENRAFIANLEAEFVERKAKLKHLEYDVNVIEKEGRKLARELDKVLRIQITEAQVHHEVSHDVSVDSSVDSSCSPHHHDGSCPPEEVAREASMPEYLADFAKRCHITGSPSSSGNSSDSTSRLQSAGGSRGQTETPELPDLGDSFLLSSPDVSPLGAAAAVVVGTPTGGHPLANKKGPPVHARMTAIKSARASAGGGGDHEAENSDTGLSSLHSSSDEATLDFGTLV